MTEYGLYGCTDVLPALAMYPYADTHDDGLQAAQALFSSSSQGRETEASFNCKRPLHCVHGGYVPFCFFVAGPAGSDSAGSDSAGSDSADFFGINGFNVGDACGRRSQLADLAAK